MFSGIVEEAATVVSLRKEAENLHLTMKCSFTHELKIDQSVAHNGVCLTVVNLEGDTYTVTAIKETLERSNLGLLKVGDKVNQSTKCYWKKSFRCPEPKSKVNYINTKCLNILSRDSNYIPFLFCQHLQNQLIQI